MPFNLKKDFHPAQLAPALKVGAGIFLIFLIAYWKSISDLFHLWDSNETYSHGFFIPLLIAYMLYLKNSTLRTIAITPAPLFLIPLLATQALWFFADLTNTLTIELTLLPFIYIFMLFTVTGYAVTQVLIAPLGFIIVGLPVWGILTPFFQSMAVAVNEFVLGLSGIPTHINGTTVSIPAGTFEVEGGCAGIRYLVVTLTLGGFYSLTSFKRYRPIIIMAIVSLILPIVFNWIRIYSIILIGHFTDMQSSLVEDHGTFGWVLYAVSLLPLYYVAHILSRREPADNSTEASQQKTPGASYSKTVFTAASVLFLLVPAIEHGLSVRKNNTLKEINAPAASSPWVGPIYMSDWKPEYRGASIEINRLYLGTEDYPDVSLHIFYYGHQDQDRELINELNNVAKHRNILEQQTVRVENHAAIENITRGADSQYLLWYWYHSNGKNLIRPVNVKMNQAIESLTGNIRSSLILARVKCKDTCADRDRNVLKEFLRKHITKIDSIF